MIGGGINMIYFTSDTHFDHKNVLSYSSRNFHDVNEMNEKIIANWNSIVRSEDTVYHLGDFAFSNPQKFIDRLVGNIIFVKGSHDKSIDAPYMRIIYPDGLKDEYGNKRSITLCHYSMRSWDKSHYASWHLYGHHHGMLEPYGLSFDVGVDRWNFFPVSLEQVDKEMSKLKPIVDYRKT
jgi:calcineurin-like phosphoesterase family protein